jgi:hypothetical protein
VRLGLDPVPGHCLNPSLKLSDAERAYIQHGCRWQEVEGGHLLQVPLQYQRHVRQLSRPSDDGVADARGSVDDGEFDVADGQIAPLHQVAEAAFDTLRPVSIGSNAGGRSPRAAQATTPSLIERFGPPPHPIARA